MIAPYTIILLAVKLLVFILLLYIVPDPTLIKLFCVYIVVLVIALCVAAFNDPVLIVPDEIKPEPTLIL